MARVKERVHDILAIPSPPGDRIGRSFDVIIVGLILLNTLAVILESVDGIFDGYERWLVAFEWFSVGVFGTEYVLRLWSVTSERGIEGVRARLRWMTTPFAVIDLLAILPALLFAVDLRFLRVLRVLRVLKLSRYAESAQILGNVLRRSHKDLLTSLFLVLLALLITSSFMYYAERRAQPEAFSSIPAAMWWGIVALTTTGYGDIVPVTTVGRFLAGVTSLVGVAAIALPIGILSSTFVQEVEARRRAHESAPPELCPHCGKEVKHTKG